MEFKKWYSIENTYRQKHIDFYLETHPELADETYVILEKLHGSNFQWHFMPGEPVQAGSRNRHLDVAASFQGASIPQLMADNAREIARFQHTADLGKCSIRLFGELIGRGIGKGVDYGEKKRILYFGMMVNEKLLPFSEFSTRIVSHHLVPVVGGECKGLESALAFDTKFNSWVLGKPDNLCEGVVIQPRDKVYYDRYGESPFILKKKNAEFKEKEQAKKVRVVDTEVERLNAEFVSYVTDNRLQAVFSKEGEIESPKQIGSYIKLVMEDAKVDFLKDFEGDVAATSKAQQKQIFNVSKTIAGMLKTYL